MSIETNQVKRDRNIKTWEERKDALKPAVRTALEAGDSQGVIDALPVLQRRFVEEYVVDFNGSQACVRAGYNCREPNKMAYQLLNNPGVRYAIDAVLLQRAKNVDVDSNYVLKKIVRTIEKAEEAGNFTAVLRGSELLAKHLGMFVERTEITGKDGEAIQLERISEDADAFVTSLKALTKRADKDAQEGEED